MHTLLSALFAMLFGFSHAAPQPQTAPAARDVRAQTTYEHIPSRYEVAQLRSGSVYAGNGCVSCRRTNVTYRVR